MKTALAMMVLVILTVAAFPAMKNEPDNFRGMKFGATIGELEKKYKLIEVDLSSDDEKSFGNKKKEYVIPNDSFVIAGAMAQEVRYCFYTGMFYSAHIKVDGKKRDSKHEEIELFLKKMHGEGESLITNVGRLGYAWSGKTISVLVRYPIFDRPFTLSYTHLPIAEKMYKATIAR